MTEPQTGQTTGQTTEHASGPAAGEKPHVFDNMRNVKRTIYALMTACGISFIAEFFVHRHVEHPWESLFDFYSFYGFFACVMLVLLAKAMRIILIRREDYYDD